MLKILRPVKVYAILTENLRRGLFQELDAQLQQLDRALDELAWKRKQLEAVAAHASQQDMQQQLDLERKRLQENRHALTERRKELVQLPLGVEMLHSTVECEVEIVLGDNWEAKANPAIVLEDGRVVELRGEGKDV